MPENLQLTSPKITVPYPSLPFVQSREYPNGMSLIVEIDNPRMSLDHYTLYDSRGNQIFFVSTHRL